MQTESDTCRPGALTVRHIFRTEGGLKNKTAKDPLLLDLDAAKVKDAFIGEIFLLRLTDLLEKL